MVQVAMNARRVVLGTCWFLGVIAKAFSVIVFTAVWPCFRASCTRRESEVSPPNARAIEGASAPPFRRPRAGGVGRDGHGLRDRLRRNRTVRGLLSAGRFPASHCRRSGRGQSFRLAADVVAAAGDALRDCRGPGGLLDRSHYGRTALSARGLALFQEEPPAARARVLRKVRLAHYYHGAVHAHRSHVLPPRCPRRENELHALPAVRYCLRVS